MKLEQIVWAEQGFQGPAGPGLRSAQWVLVFGGSAELAREERMGPGATLCGFYSYGEIAPFASESRCELHNQTMSLTLLSER